MGKGLSPQQKNILEVLSQWPSYEQATATTPGQVGEWARPGDIIAGLNLPKTSVTRASLSRALARLHERGLVARASGKLASVGKSFRYLKITDPINAGAGNDGPLAVLRR